MAAIGQLRGAHKGQAGVGLVEIMISLVLGLLVTGAIVQVYLTTKRQNDMQGSLTARQESARFAAQTIQLDAQMAGFRGCLRDSGKVTNTLVNPTDFLYRFERPVEGFNNGVGVPASITSVVAGTDVLTLRTVDDTGLQTTAAMGSSSTDPVTIAGLNPAPLVANDFALIADCSGASIFQVTGFDPSTGIIVHNTGGAVPGNTSKNLVRRYAAGTQVFKVRTTTYFIRNSANNTGPALWRRSGDVAAAQELAEGVENLQVRYGVDTDGNQTADEYRTANNVGATEWANVVSLQVAILVTGVTDRVVETDPRTFTLLDQVVGPFADGRLRRVLSFTVALRNRLA